MALSRSAATVLLRSSARRTCRLSAAPHTLAPTRRAVPTQPFAAMTMTMRERVRWHSASASASGSLSKVYDFSQVKAISEQPSTERILVDVREPSEYEAGFIPSAINLPIKSQPDALFLPGDEFEDRFGFEKPATDKEVVFYCKSGVRSSAAAQLAQQHGYTNVAEYRGSWVDWVKNNGTASKP